MANTVIQLKYSEGTATPTSLNVAEPAYSNSSNKLFIGLSGNQVVAIGGKYYTDIVDAATDANTVSTIVKRDVSGMFSATAVKASLFGNANTASIWATARNIGVSGDANGIVSVDGSANANIPLVLGNSGVSAGTYGGATQIPTFSVDSKGRLTSAANVAISTSLTVNGDTGTNVITLGTDTLTFVGGDGITTSITPTDNVRFDVDNTVLRTTGNQTLTGDLSVTGNLIVQGERTIVNTSTVSTTDSLIKLAANNTVGDVIDIGFYGGANTGNAVTYHGLIRQAGTANTFVLFKNFSQDPSSNVVNSAYITVANTATLRANITGGTVSSLAAAIAIADGGTGQTSFTTGQYVTYDGTKLVSRANTGAPTITGALASGNTITSLTLNDYGDVTAFTASEIAIAASQITSGNLVIARGGTNNNGGYTTGGILQFDGTKFVSLANSSYTLTGALQSNNTVTALSVDSYGRVTAATGAAISGLTVAQGGTGFSSYTANGVIFGGVTSTSPLTSVASSTEGHVLQINSSGIPTFAHLNGGSF